MAKGDPSGVYVPEAYSGLQTVEDLARWIHEEHMRVSAAFELAIVREVEFLNAVPAKLREGMIRGADGTNWNPGAGKGVYAYYTGAWHLLG